MKKLELDYVSYFERKMYRTLQLNIIYKPIRTLRVAQNSIIDFKDSTSINSILQIILRQQLLNMKLYVIGPDLINKFDQLNLLTLELLFQNDLYITFQVIYVIKMIFFFYFVDNL